MKKSHHLFWATTAAVALVFGAQAIVESSSSKDSHAKHEVNWGYYGELGPNYWGKLRSEFSICGAGKQQSPINITSAVEKRISGINFSYQNSPIRIINNGHTIQMNYESGSIVNIRGEVYNLLQFHFHTPSENTLYGAPYEMEMHLVHKNQKGELAVVGVFMKKGKHNSELAKLWRHFPEQENEEKVINALQINANNLLPDDKIYYHFAGSLTTPPCSEGVNWNVLKTPIEVSQEQIAKFANIFTSNARPIQPLNNRNLVVSF